jgi:large repetitive protein
MPLAHIDCLRRGAAAAILLLVLSIAAGCGGGGDGPAPSIPPPGNRAPLALDDAITVAARSLSEFINVLANDSDPDGDTLTIIAASIVSSFPPTSEGSVAIAPGQSLLVYQAPTTFVGTQLISYTVSDGRGGIDHATVTVTVTPRPLPPLTQVDAFTVSLDSAANPLDVLANDIDRSGGGLTLTGVSTVSRVPAGAAGTTGIVANRIRYTPASGFVGVETLRYTVRDANGLSGSGTVLVSVLAVAGAPVALPDVATIAVGSSQQMIDVLANDVDLVGGGLTLTGVNALATVPPGVNGSFGMSGNRVVYTPPSPVFVGVQTATYTVEDINGTEATGLLTIIVALDPGQLPPVALPDVAAVAPNSSDNVLDVLANDLDASGTGLTITGVTIELSVPAAMGASASTDGAHLLFTPPAGYSGVVTLQYTVEDGNGATASAAAVVTVLPIVLPPVPLPDVAIVSSTGGATLINVLANDVDTAGGGLTLTGASVLLAVPLSPGSIAVSANQVLYTPAFLYIGVVTVSYTVTDINGSSAPGELVITVLP